MIIFQNISFQPMNIFYFVDSSINTFIFMKKEDNH